MKILWLTPPRFAGGLKSLLNSYLQRAGINPFDIEFECLTTGCLIKKTKTTYTWKKDNRVAFFNQLLNHSPDIVIVNDKAALGFITDKYISLDKCRGSVFKIQDKRIPDKEIPCLVIDDIYKIKSTKTGGWIFLQDLQKIKRWIKGAQRHEPKFQYTVCKTTRQLTAFAEQASERHTRILANDIETSGRGRNCIITCSGYTLLNDNGNIHTFVLPFFDGSKSTGCFWENPADEVYAWQIIQKIHRSNISKTFQNGTYDNTHLIRHHCPSNNWYLDTLNFMHALFPESKKTLAFISSLCLDYYTYWKDEGKEDDNENAKGSGSTADAVPTTAIGMENYWRYNALDCHNTLLCTLHYVNLYSNEKLDWALFNYCEEIEQVTGPAFAMSMRGVKINQNVKTFLSQQNLTATNKAYRDLKIMVNDDDFNPGSPKQVASLIYNVLRAQPIPRKAGETGEPVLKLIQTQNPLLEIIINQIWKTKKPANNVSKYGDYQHVNQIESKSEDSKSAKSKASKGLILLNGRWMYKMNGTGTETWRYASKAHDLWIGTQIQNVPYSIRPMVEADPGYILFDIDYAQSDAYFTAFSLEEQNFIKTMLSPDDTHCLHAAFFFKRDFNELVTAHKAKLDWCSHNITGVRSITKRVVYGANYLMAGFTLFITMGKEAVAAAALQLGYAEEEVNNWEYTKYINLCTRMLASYFELYPGLKPRLLLEMNHATRNGNRFQCAFGKTRTFFGSLTSDNASQREFAAFIGQGGTAGNINKALRNVFYDGLERRGVMLLFQVHDSIIGQIPSTHLNLLDEIQAAMANTCVLHGRTFTVPTDVQVGRGWGKRMIGYKKGITTLADIDKHDNEWFEKNCHANYSTN